MEKMKILVNAPAEFQDEFEKFATKIDGQILITERFDGATIIHLLLEYGPDVLTAVAAFIASLKAGKIEINVNLPSLSEDKNDE